MKRTPLSRGSKGLKRSPLARGWSSLTRSRLRPVSDHRKEVNAKRKALMDRRFGPRETWRCWFAERPAIVIAGGCYGPLSGHEILKRSRAGSTDANLLNMDGIVILCSRHQTWVEDNPALANKLGLADHGWEGRNE